MGDSSLSYVLFNVPPCPQRFQHHQQRRVNTVSSRLFSAPRRAQSEAFLHHQRSRGIGRTHYSEVNEEWVPWKPKGASQDSPSPGFPRATHFAKKIGFYETLTINFRISMSASIFLTHRLTQLRSANTTQHSHSLCCSKTKLSEHFLPKEYALLSYEVGHLGNQINKATKAQQMGMYLHSLYNMTGKCHNIDIILYKMMLNDICLLLEIQSPQLCQIYFRGLGEEYNLEKVEEHDGVLNKK